MQILGTPGIYELQPKLLRGVHIGDKNRRVSRGIEQETWSLDYSPYAGCQGDMIQFAFSKITGTMLRVPIIRTFVFRGLYWGPLL